MAIFGKDLDVFQQIAGGNLNVLRDLISSSANLMKQQRPSQQGVPAHRGEPAVTVDTSGSTEPSRGT
jgi:hypothetical protein